VNNLLFTVSSKIHFNTTNLNSVVFFSFCRSLYQYITVHIFCQTEAAKFAYYMKIPYCLLSQCGVEPSQPHSFIFTTPHWLESTDRLLIIINGSDVDKERAGQWSKKYVTCFQSVSLEFFSGLKNYRYAMYNYWWALSGGRCGGSFQFVLITDCQPHPTVYRRWPSFSSRRCSCLEQSAWSCHLCTFRSCLPVSAQNPPV